MDSAAPGENDHTDSGAYGLPEIKALTGLRGVAAADVAINHLGQGHIQFLNGIAFHNPAVDIFFCLSGFTLSMVYRLGSDQQTDLRKFAVARFARLYPLYAVILAIGAAYSWAWGVNAFDAYRANELRGDALRQIFMVNAWPIVGTGAHWVDPLWSLSIETLCYVAAFPLLSAMSHRFRRFPQWVLLLGVAASTLAAFVMFTLYYNPAINSHRVTAATGFLIHWVGAVRGLSMFSAGWLAYLLAAYRPAVMRRVAGATDLVALGALLVIAGQAFGFISAEMLVVLAPFLVMGLFGGSSWSSRLLSTRVPHALGLISYSIYLWHWPIMMFIWKWLPGISTNDGLRLAVALPATLVLSTASYWLIETPARHWIRRVLAAPPQARGVSIAA